MQFGEWSARRVEGGERAEAVVFIATQFEQHFGAEVRDDTEEVYVVVGPDGRIDAAFGLNRRYHRFFARHYLADLNQTLAAVYAGAFADDSNVVELAHLCVRNARGMCRLVPILAEFLAVNADFIVCTATRELASLFKRKGLAPDVLASATPQRLPVEHRGRWGSYYEHAPLVLSGDLQEVCASLRHATPYASGSALRERAVA